jgi:hypothetical protein
MGETNVAGGFVSGLKREVFKLESTYNFEINATLPHFTL